MECTSANRSHGLPELWTSCSKSISEAERSYQPGPDKCVLRLVLRQRAVRIGQRVEESASSCADATTCRCDSRRVVCAKLCRHCGSLMDRRRVKALHGHRMVPVALRGRNGGELVPDV